MKPTRTPTEAESEPEATVAEPHGSCSGEAHGHACGPSAYEPRAFERAAALFRAAGDVPRLRLLERLAHGEHCVSELAAVMGEGLPVISQRLRVLRAEGLVERRRQGKHIYYALSDGHVAALLRNALDHASEHAHTHSQLDEAPPRHDD